MSDDLIRRREMGEAIDRIRLDLKHETFYSIYQKVLIALNEVPTVNQWIPCKERVPDYDVEVLATTEWGGVTIAERNEPRNGEKAYWLFLAEGNVNGEKDDVIAWMPLPEPYKEENDGTVD